MDDIIGMAASAAGGGVFGVLGSVLGRVAKYFERRQDLAHERLRWAHETELIRLQSANALEENEAMLAQMTEEGRWTGLQTSLASDARLPPSYRWVAAVRGLTRPVLTLFLWFITAGIWLSASEASRLTIIETVTFAATAATLWWFGDRAAHRA